MSAVVIVEALVVSFCILVLAALAVIRRSIKQLARLTITLQASLDAEHDLRTPMATILGLADALDMFVETGGIDPQMRRKLNAAIKEQGNVFFHRLEGRQPSAVNKARLAQVDLYDENRARSRQLRPEGVGAPAPATDEGS